MVRSLGAAVVWGQMLLVLVLSSSIADEVFGRYDKIEGLRCIGGVGDGRRATVLEHAGAAMRRKWVYVRANPKRRANEGRARNQESNKSCLTGLLQRRRRRRRQNDGAENAGNATSDRECAQQPKGSKNKGERATCECNSCNNRVNEAKGAAKAGAVVWRHKTSLGWLGRDGDDGGDRSWLVAQP
jgi:hypothetical protein